jgi:hypothetical protein
MRRRGSYIFQTLSSHMALRLSALLTGRSLQQPPPPPEDTCYSFLSKAESTPEPLCGWRNLPYALIGSRPRDLPASNIVPSTNYSKASHQKTVRKSNVMTRTPQYHNHSRNYFLAQTYPHFGHNSGTQFIIIHFKCC